MTDTVEKQDAGMNPAIAEIFAEDDARTKKGALVKLLIYSFLLGLVAEFLPEDNRVVDLIIGAPVLILGIIWCLADANQHGHRIGPVMRVCLVLFFIFALPIYLFQTRGLGGFKSVFLLGLFVIAMFACLMAGMLPLLMWQILVLKEEF